MFKIILIACKIKKILIVLKITVKKMNCKIIDFYTKFILIILISKFLNNFNILVKSDISKVISDNKLSIISRSSSILLRDTTESHIKYIEKGNKKGIKIGQEKKGKKKSWW